MGLPEPERVVVDLSQNLVAAEVKGLADQTAKATTEIARQIAAIQEATSGSVRSICGDRKSVV